MLEIKLYLSRHWSQWDKISPQERFFPIDDTLSAKELFCTSPSSSMGRVVIEKYGCVYLDEECDLDDFLNAIVYSKEDIFSGIPYTVDNSYFQLSFLDRHYRHKFLIQFKSKTLAIEKSEFIEAFRLSAKKYYQLLAEFHPTDYGCSAKNLDNIW